MTFLHFKFSKRIKQTTALVLIALLVLNVANGGILITNSSGVTLTGADGVTYADPVGVTLTGADGLLAFNSNGINAPTGSGVTLTGADGMTYLGSNGVLATSVDGMTINRADGITLTGADGITITGADGTTYNADSALIRHVDGVTTTGADGVTALGADGITLTGADSGDISYADGISATGIDSITITSAEGMTVTGTDGQVFSISPNGVSVTGIDNMTGTGANGISISGANITDPTGTEPAAQTGLQSVDPELAVMLDRATDDSFLNAAVVYHQLPTDADIDTLRQIGVMGGTRYHKLPVILLTATREQLLRISRLPTVRSIYGNRTLQLVGEPGNGLTGTVRVKQDADLTLNNSGRVVTGRGVTVAVLDSGLDATHADLAGRVVKNVKLVSTLGIGLGFNYSLVMEGLLNTDLVSGHGTFVGGVIAGNGARSNGRYSGVAPGANLVGVGIGDLSLFWVLEGIDYLLTKGAALGVRVVNCSFSANTVFDPHDPVNVGTKMLTEQGINVVFSAGNSGPGPRTLNPYAMAPWVISVGATDERGRLASFSSRGSFDNPNARPTVIAPGVNVISLRATGLNLTGTSGLLLGGDLSRLSLLDMLYYTTGSGTSFSAPQVAGTIALMLETNPLLTPDDVRDILQRSATPLPPYYRHEVGAGMLNAHAAVLNAAFPERRAGLFRATLDRGQVKFVIDPPRQFSGTVIPGTTYATSVPIPQNTLVAAAQIAWGSITSTNDLAMKMIDPNGTPRAEVNNVNLPINLLGLTGRHESDTLSQPIPGNWSVQVRNTLGIVGTPQPFIGVLDVTHADYRPLTDLNNLGQTAQAEIYQNLRSFVLFPSGGHFRPQFSVSRYDLSTALILGARVPQYLARQPWFTDTIDGLTRLMVESVQAAPCGALFPDALKGGSFRPDSHADRLSAAIALVRAAGLRAEAEASNWSPLPVSDAGSIPAQWRGYVVVALSRGLLTATDGMFRPAAALTRVELSHAMVTIAKLATS